MNRQLIAALCLTCAATAGQAATTNYTVGSLLSGSYTPSASFATLSASTTDSLTYTFTLVADDLTALFGTKKAFVGSMVVDTTPDVGKKRVDVPLPSNATALGGGVAGVYVANGKGPTGDFNFRYDFGNGNDKLVAGETISWTSTFARAVSLDHLALHVQGLTAAEGSSAWYTLAAVTPVPEPDNYAMLLAGLGLMSLVARRRIRA